LVASIAALTEQAGRLALDAAVDAARADAQGRMNSVVESVCRLAVGSGVTAGEVAWLAGELESAMPTEQHRAEAVAAISSMSMTMTSVAAAVQDVADRGAPVEVGAAAEALRRVAIQLLDLLGRLQLA
jgi:methyl-accepting chemotaxis protein